MWLVTGLLQWSFLLNDFPKSHANAQPSSSCVFRRNNGTLDSDSGRRPELQRGDYERQMCCHLLLSECLAHDLGRPRGLVGLLTSRSALSLAGDNALLATSRTCSGYWNCIICLEQERTSMRPWGYLISICQIINECAIILNFSCSTSPCIQSLIADWVTGSFPFKVYDSLNYLKPLLTQKC